MFQTLPPLLRKASVALIVGLIGLCLVLVVNRPIPYIITMGIGCVGVGIAVLLYLVYFFEELRNPESFE